MEGMAGRSWDKDWSDEEGIVRGSGERVIGRRVGGEGTISEREESRRRDGRRWECGVGDVRGVVENRKEARTGGHVGRVRRRGKVCVRGRRLDRVLGR
jgi:hypothetical protein